MNSLILNSMPFIGWGIIICTGLVIILFSVGGKKDNTTNTTREYTNINRWDIAWGVAYGLIVATPILVFLVSVLVLLFGLGGLAGL